MDRSGGGPSVSNSQASAKASAQQKARMAERLKPQQEDNDVGRVTAAAAAVAGVAASSVQFANLAAFLRHEDSGALDSVADKASDGIVPATGAAPFEFAAREAPTGDASGIDPFMPADLSQSDGDTAPPPAPEIELASAPANARNTSARLNDPITDAAESDGMRDTPDMITDAVASQAAPVTQSGAGGRGPDGDLFLADLTDLSFVGGIVAENANEGTLIGTLSAADIQPGVTVTYRFTDAAGNDIFPEGVEIVGNEIRVTDPDVFDYETVNSLSFFVRASDGLNSGPVQQVQIQITDVDEAPTDIDLAGVAVSEDPDADSRIDVSVSDPEGGAFTFMLSDGRFEMVADGDGYVLKLREGVVLDHETEPSIPLSITATDASGLSYSESAVIEVTDANEVPDISIAQTVDIAEDSPTGTVVATLSGADVDGDAVVFVLTDAQGLPVTHPDLEVVGAEVRVKATSNLDFETAPSVTFHVAATDGALTSEPMAGTVNIGDVAEEIVLPDGGAIFVDRGVTERSVTGGAGADQITGSAGDDLLTGGGGDDLLEGGAGSDTAVYQGDLSDMLIVYDPDADSFQITDTSGTEGQDTVSGIETFVFNGVAISATYLQGIAALQANAAPEDVTIATGGSVAENADGGTLIARLTATDAEGDDLSYTITDENGVPVDHPLFEISGDSLLLKPGAVLDHESAAAHDLFVTATDPLETSAPAPIRVTVSDVNEGPTDIVVSGGQVQETVADGGTIASAHDASDVTAAVLTTVDPDNNDSFSYAILSDPSGHFTIVGDEIRVKVGEIIDFEAATSHDLVVQVTDQGGNTYSETVTIDVLDFEASYMAALFSETITGSSEEDNITGSAGDDVITGSAGPDLIDGGAGRDTVDYSDSSEGVDVDLGTGLASGGDAEGDRLTSVENIVGSDAADNVVGSTDGTAATLGAGDDVFTGASGDADDTVLAGAGDDTITGGAGDDSIDGGADTDRAIWAGDLADFSIIYDSVSDTFTVTDLNATDGDEGTDTVTGVESFEFNGTPYSYADMVTEAARQANTDPTDIVMSGGTVGETVSDGGSIAVAYDPSGATVATLTTVDPQADDTHSYSIVSDASDKFEIVGNEIRVKSGQSIDYETDQSFDLTVRTTDQFGASHDKTLTINVQDFEGSASAVPGADTLTGTSEEDAISWARGDGSDVIDGGTGDDTLTVGASVTDMALTSDGTLDFDAVDGSGEAVAQSGIETIVFDDASLDMTTQVKGTSAGDSVTGTAATDIITAAAAMTRSMVAMGRTIFSARPALTR